MPQAVLEIVASTSLFESLPFNIAQRSSRTSALIILLLLLPALGTTLVPASILVVFGPTALSIAADNPGAAAQVVVGLVLWSVIFVMPAKRIIQRFGTGRQIRIEAGIVTVSEIGLFGSREWQAPLHEFRGIVHHVRSTLSGLRHELLLIHGERRRSLLLYTANQISQTTIARASSLLELPELPAGELYRRNLRRPPEAACAGPIGRPQAA
jgi:hypothetical protein